VFFVNLLSSPVRDAVNGAGPRDGTPRRVVDDTGKRAREVGRRTREEVGMSAPTTNGAPAPAGGSTPAPQQAFATEREVIDYFTTLSREVDAARVKIGELAVSLREHVNVLDNVKGLDPSRKCFRSVGGVLVERTVKEVAPAVEANASNLRRAIDAIKEQVEVKEAELEALRRKYKIRVSGEDETTGEHGGAPGYGGGSGGVLA